MLFLSQGGTPFEFLELAFSVLPPQEAFLALGCILPPAPFHPEMLFPSQGGTPFEFLELASRSVPPQEAFLALGWNHLRNSKPQPRGKFHPRKLFLLLDVFCLRRPSTLRSFSRFRVEPPPQFKAPAPGRVPPQDAFLALGRILPQAPFHPKKLFPL